MSTHPELRARVDEFELNLFQVPSTSMNHQALPNRNDSFFGPRYGPFKHNEVVLHDTIVWETSHGGDAFFGRVMFSRSVIIVFP